MFLNAGLNLTRRRQIEILGDPTDHLRQTQSFEIKLPSNGLKFIEDIAFKTFQILY